ncbi:MAG: ABC transporter substrate-binding protein, partial [Rhizobacter sp.]
RKFAVVRNFHASVEAAGLTTLGLGLESWINAQVMAEGLKRCGRDVTREKLRAALAGLRNFEVGEVAINFTNAAPYVGTTAVKLGIFGSDGILRS